MAQFSSDENTLYYGDNLPILQNHDYFPNGFVDLIYLDPPFNSNRNYNVLFKDEGGTEAEAQITAFEDTWHWNQDVAHTYFELQQGGPPHVRKMIIALHDFIGENQLMAYLVMMAVRLVELHRVLKSTGSLYLHCDPTASHYLKIILDTIFDPRNFQNEIIWKRTSAHSDGAQGTVIHMGRIHDVILFYTKSNAARRNEIYQPHSEKYLSSFYRHADPDGRRYQLDNITGPGGASKGNPQYEFLGVTRYWRYSKARMQELYAQGRIVQTKPGTVPRYKRYLDEMPGVPLQDEWDDIQAIQSKSAERLGYPTQKPLALLERIIQASSNPGDLVLDPFAGCGTTVAAAQKLGRRWIGIDITHLAIRVLKNRLLEMYPGIDLKVVGEPPDIGGARQLWLDDRFEFQYWAISQLGPNARLLGDKKKKGADKGVDGILTFRDVDNHNRLASQIAIIQVKGGENIKSGDIRDLVGTMKREEAAIGIFITLNPSTSEMRKEAASAGFYRSAWTGKDYPRIQIVTVQELLHASEATDIVKLPPQIGGRQAQRTRIDGFQTAFIDSVSLIPPKEEEPAAPLRSLIQPYDAPPREAIDAEINQIGEPPQIKQRSGRLKKNTIVRRD